MRARPEAIDERMRVPLYVEASKLTVVVFGGGKVGTRRAQKFANAGARVRVVAKEFSEDLYYLNVELVKSDLEREDEIRKLIEDADIVVIATNNKEVNDKIFRIAKEMGKLVNDATEASRSDVHVPFEAEVDGIRIAVTSEGASGVAAHVALALIERCLKSNEFFKRINEFARRFKRELKELIDDPKRRFGLYWYVMLQRDIIEMVREGKIDEALEKALAIAKSYEGEGMTDVKYALGKFLEEWGDELLRAWP
ncbi:precorrin-2 dehydrogenase/sirohydrochlorin ferrochelatase family protein [Ignicoccus hospitalis]|uniref:precorrin-2 dehydrogenase n=1 Tax=Ignicoccus hospitalis (strain KIN4/I / DSM 18386 / JCM 14125) TaxID=453591 RepID=A8A9R4_IGNH4|nr:bifunctional precorrin-2 dehydrogenase/sirohydrochlorin ferrochelatase [Ignicoccus hospitalis]ABU81666.1 siroheme synthase [Ignicoccus hospitalis KIN4/I]